MFHKLTADAFVRDARKYISTLDSNFALMTNYSCRLESCSRTQHGGGRLFVRLRLVSTSFQQTVYR